jgi:hypothetical protein
MSCVTQHRGILAPESLLPGEGEKVADRPYEGAGFRMKSDVAANRRDTPSSVSFADTFSPY